MRKPFFTPSYPIHKRPPITLMHLFKILSYFLVMFFFNVHRILATADNFRDPPALS